MKLIVAGIHTGIGKTICSAVLCQSFGYDYWKPVQAGDLENSDSHFVRHHTQNTSGVIHPERYRLKEPASPHYSASLEGITIGKSAFVLPETTNGLVVETAGGVMSPLASGFLVIDLIEHLGLPVVLVSRNYLGSINHTLLTASALKQRNIPVLGLVFSGERGRHSEDFIREYTGLRTLFSIPFFETIGPDTIPDFVKHTSISLEA